MPPGSDEKPVEIVFEPSGGAPSAPPAASPPAAAEPAPTPTTPPEPNAPPPPTPAPPAPEIAPEPAAPPRPPTPPAPPRVNLNLEPPPAEASPELEVPRPLPPPPPRPHPAPVARAPRNEFTPFMRDYSFSGPPPAPSSPGRAGRGVDLSLGAPSSRPSGRQDTPRGDVTMVQGRATRDWGRELVAWVKAHAYYPSQAAENGEDGDVVVQVRADSTGRVLSVDLVGRSGSLWLDLALQAIFRRATIPPFPPDMTDPTVTFDFTMHYILLR